MWYYADYLERAGYRLPAEEGWEFACRAGTATTRYCGDAEAILADYAWYLDNARPENRRARSWSVGRLRPNDLGFFDLLGNARE